MECWGVIVTEAGRVTESLKLLEKPWEVKAEVAFRPKMAVIIKKVIIFLVI